MTELELLKRQNKRSGRKKFDDLCRCVDEFERQDSNEDESYFAVDDNIVEDHKDWVRKVFGKQSEINLVSVS